MAMTEDSVEAWLQTPFPGSDSSDRPIWDPGFDPERRIVVSRLGPYYKVFLRPPRFVKRFYHTVYPLLIENWNLATQAKLYDGFCTMDVALEVRFQATLKYVEKNLEFLSKINEHIKTVYEGILIDILDKELLELADGEWVQTGLNPVARQIENAINETLMLKNIQCRALCSLQPSFEDFSDDETIDSRFVQESVYLNIVKKNFEFREKKAQEAFRQEQKLEQEKLEQKRKMLEQLNEEDEIVRQKQAIEAENIKRQLMEQKQHLDEQLTLEEKLLAEKVKHEVKMKEIEQEAKEEEQRKLLLRQQQIEQDLLEEKLKHQEQIKDRETEMEIEQYEKQQRKWLEAKRRLQEEKYRNEELLSQREREAEFKAQEQHQLEKQKLLEQLRQEQLKHEARIKEMELEAELIRQQKQHETTEKTEDFLRKEIEMLVLEKQRAELNEEIKRVQAEE